MIVAGEVIERAWSLRRTAVWLPVTRGSVGQRRPCPVAPETVISLQPAPFVKGLKVTIMSVGLCAFEPLSIEDARSLGAGSVALARTMWRREHGQVTDETTVWAVPFVLGDHSAFLRKHAQRYLRSKMGGGRNYTTNARHGLRGEGAVPNDVERRFAAAARINREAAAHETLQETLETMRAALAKTEAIEGRRRGRPHGPRVDAPARRASRERDERRRLAPHYAPRAPRPWQDAP